MAGIADDGGDQTSGETAVTEELNPEIGLVGALAIGVGTMIAAGIFVLSGLAVSNVGAVAIGSFLLAAVIAGFTAAAYAEFSSIYQESGGGYMFVSNTFDSDLTYIMGWTMILGYPASAAFYLASFSEWFFRFIYPVLNLPRALPFWIPGLAVLAVLVLINLKGTEESNQFQIVVTALKVALLALFLFGGLQTFDSAVISQSIAENIDRVSQIGLTSALVFITFFGFSAITTNAEEIKSPGRTIPRAIYLSMGIVTAIYTLVVLVVVLAVNDPGFLDFLTDTVQLGGLDPVAFVAENGEVSMGYAAQYYLGPIGFYVIIVGALFSMLSAANATIMAGSRVKLSMARRRHLPRGFEDIHPDFNTPYRAVMLTGGIILVYIFVFAVIFGEGTHAGSEPLFGLHLGIEGLAQFANFLLLSGLSMVNLALIQSRRKYPGIDREFRVPLVPIVPIVAVIANLALLLNVGLVAMAIGLGAELLGVVVWFAWKRRPPDLEKLEAETPTAVAEYTAPGEGYQVVVPIANPRNVDQLMRTAATLAADNDGEIIVMSVVTVPEQTPLSRGRERTHEKRGILNRAMDVAREEEIPVSGTIRIGHTAAAAILNTIAQHDADAVVLGWKGRRTHRRDVVFGTNVDIVVRDAPCDVYLEKFGMGADGQVDSILLPIAGGPHASLAAETAGAISRRTGATVHPTYVIDPDADEADREYGRRLLDDAGVDLVDVPTEPSLLKSDSVVDALVTECRSHDLTIIGATREGTFQKFMFGTIPETVAERAPTTVIMTKRHLDVGTRLQESVRKLGERATGRENPLEREEDLESAGGDRSEEGPPGDT